MGLPSEEVVDIRPGPKKGDPTVINISCPDQLGLACDLARILFEFGLTVVRGELYKDGKWCFVLFWVTPNAGSSKPMRWAQLKKRLVSACPSMRPHLLLRDLMKPKSKDSYVVQTCSLDRPGLLSDLAQALWELELSVFKMNVTISPDGKAINLFYISDIRELFHERRRQDDLSCRLKSILGTESGSCCEVRHAGSEWGGPDCTIIPNLPPSIADNLFSEGTGELQNVSVTLDNTLSPGHTLLQILCQDRRSLLYDCTRVLKDFQLQVGYGRLIVDPKGKGEIDFFILQEDGKKIMDPQKQKILCSCLEMEIVQPFRVMFANRGPDIELLVATLVEKSERLRPRVLYDVTFALKMLDIGIFKADICKHSTSDRQWEIYRFLLMDRLDQDYSNTSTQAHIKQEVWNVLTG